MAGSTYKQRFQDHIMQSQYEDMLKQGVHWKIAERKVLSAHRDYGLDV